MRLGERVNARRWYARYLLANIFEACVGFGAAAGGITYFFDEHSLLDASIGEGLQGLAMVWSALYVAGGMLMLVGLLRARLRAELVGLCLFFPAALLEAVTILTIAGAKGAAPGMLFAGLALATVVRAGVVLRMAEEYKRGP